MKTIAEIQIKLTHDPKLPNILTVDMPYGYHPGEGGEIYLNEHDGTGFASLWPAINPLFTRYEHADTNRKNEAWINFFGDPADFDGKTFNIRLTQEEDEGGNFTETAELIS